MMRYGAEFDRLAHRWGVLENIHDDEHPDRDQCGGVGGCSLMAAATMLEQDMIEVLNKWRRTRDSGTA